MDMLKQFEFIIEKYSKTFLFQIFNLHSKSQRIHKTYIHFSSLKKLSLTDRHAYIIYIILIFKKIS